MSYLYIVGEVTSPAFTLTTYTMSRITKKTDTGSIAYGHDNDTGYFFQVYETGNIFPILSECETDTGMTTGRMLGLMELNDANEEHKDAVENGTFGPYQPQVN